MSKNNIEKQLLEEINRIDEGLALGLLKWIMKPAVKKAMKKLGKDPEFKAAIEDHNYHAQRLKDLSKKLADHPNPKFRELAKKISR
tara:strand:- start:218 stop:475 length:258 start_codon:yes stop_codon:yes gene_type:complete